VSAAAAPDPEADALFEIVRQRYGDRLTREQLDELSRIVQAQVEAARALRAVRLTNADEPMQPFAPYREESPLTFDPLTPPSPQRGEGDAR
jgi:Rad3-related DNA helicase